MESLSNALEEVIGGGGRGEIGDTQAYVGHTQSHAEEMLIGEHLEGVDHGADAVGSLPDDLLLPERGLGGLGASRDHGEAQGPPPTEEDIEGLELGGDIAVVDLAGAHLIQARLDASGDDSDGFVGQGKWPLVRRSRGGSIASRRATRMRNR